MNDLTREDLLADLEALMQSMRIRHQYAALWALCDVVAPLSSGDDETAWRKAVTLRERANRPNDLADDLAPVFVKALSAVADAVETVTQTGRGEVH